MNHKQKASQKYPAGWDERRVREVLAHYENQTEDERAAELEANRIADAWQKIDEAIKHFNQSNQSRILKAPEPENGSGGKRIQPFRQRNYCLLNWSGQDEDGKFNEYYEITLSTQLPAMDQPFRPVLCTIFKRFRPATEFPTLKRKLTATLDACVDGVTLEVKKKTAVVITGVSTTVYPKQLDAGILSDALIRLEHSSHNLRAVLQTKRSHA